MTMGPRVACARALVALGTSVTVFAFAACAPAATTRRARPVDDGLGAVDDSGGAPPPMVTAMPATPLGPEPTVPPDHLGRAWLESVHTPLHEQWADGFLEQARLYLPPDHALNRRDLVAHVDIVVDAKGQLLEASLARSSGLAEFDVTALLVVRAVAPFPALPAELLSDDGRGYVSWRFARDARREGIAGAQFERREWPLARAVPMLLAAGRFDDAGQRVAGAAEATEGAGGDRAELMRLYREIARAELVRGFDDADSDTRVGAVRAAGAAGLTDQVPRLQVLATSDAAPETRLAALAALGALGDLAALPTLRAATAGLDGARGAVAAAALAHLGERGAAWALLAEPLADAEAGERARAAALEAVAAVGAPESAPALAALLADRTQPRAHRALAARALGPVLASGGAGAEAALLAALREGDAALRAAAADGLAAAARRGFRSRAAYYRLLPLLPERDARVRAAAVGAAIVVKPDAALLEVIVLLRREADPAVLVVAATALGEIVEAGAIAPLLRLAGHADPTVRLAALRSLARRRDPAAKARLVAGLTDEDPTVRALALPAESSLAAIVGALADASIEVRAVAAGELVRREGDAALARIAAVIAGSRTPRERVLIAGAWLVANSPPR